MERYLKCPNIYGIHIHINWVEKETPHIKHTLYTGVFPQSLANDLSQFER